jgi:hypothetical protein
MHTDADRPPVRRSSSGSSRGASSATISPQEPEARSAPLPREVDKTAATISNDGKRRARVDAGAACRVIGWHALTEARRKGVASVSGPALGSGRVGRLSFRPTDHDPQRHSTAPFAGLRACHPAAVWRPWLPETRNMHRSPTRLAEAPQDWKKPAELSILWGARYPLKIEGPAPQDWARAPQDWSGLRLMPSRNP